MDGDLKAEGTGSQELSTGKGCLDRVCLDLDRPSISCSGEAGKSKLQDSIVLGDIDQRSENHAKSVYVCS